MIWQLDYVYARYYWLEKHLHGRDDQHPGAFRLVFLVVMACFISAALAVSALTNHKVLNWFVEHSRFTGHTKWDSPGIEFGYLCILMSFFFVIWRYRSGATSKIVDRFGYEKIESKEEFFSDKWFSLTMLLLPPFIAGAMIVMAYWLAFVFFLVMAYGNYQIWRRHYASPKRV